MVVFHFLSFKGLIEKIIRDFIADFSILGYTNLMFRHFNKETF